MAPSLIEKLREWCFITRFKTDWVLFVLHRVSGWLMLFFLTIHVLTGYVPRGVWLVIIGMIIVFHGINGLRIIMVEWGFIPRLQKPLSSIEMKPWMYNWRNRAFKAIILLAEIYVFLYLATRFLL